MIAVSCISMNLITLNITYVVEKFIIQYINITLWNIINKSTEH